jgi:hypothetical protein
VRAFCERIAELPAPPPAPARRPAAGAPAASGAEGASRTPPPAPGGEEP